MTPMMPSAKITVEYTNADGSEWRLDAKGAVVIENNSTDYMNVDLDHLLNNIFNTHEQYQLRVDLERSDDGYYYKLTRTGTRKRVEVAEVNFDSIENAMADHDIPLTAKITTGPGWIEFYWKENN